MNREDWLIREEAKNGVEAYIDSLLRLWAKSMAGGLEDIGYKRRSAGFSCGSLSSFEDLEDECDSVQAAAAGRCIEDMGEGKRPIYAAYLCCRWSGGDLGLALLEAVEEFERRARAVGAL